MTIDWTKPIEDDRKWATHIWAESNASGVPFLTALDSHFCLLYNTIHLLAEEKRMQGDYMVEIDELNQLRRDAARWRWINQEIGPATHHQGKSSETRWCLWVDGHHDSLANAVDREIEKGQKDG